MCIWEASSCDLCIFQDLHLGKPCAIHRIPHTILLYTTYTLYYAYVLPWGPSRKSLAAKATEADRVPDLMTATARVFRNFESQQENFKRFLASLSGPYDKILNFFALDGGEQRKLSHGAKSKQSAGRTACQILGCCLSLTWYISSTEFLNSLGTQLTICTMFGIIIYTYKESI